VKNKENMNTISKKQTLIIAINNLIMSDFHYI